MKKMNTISHVAILPISENHIGGLRDCAAVIAGERQFLSFVEPPDEETLRALVGKQLADKMPLLVAVDDETVVGWCAVAPIQDEGFAHVGKLGIGMLPGYRRKGIGTGLLQQTLHRAKKLGLTRIELEVFSSNENAITFYTKHAFRLEGCKRKAHCTGGIYRDVIVMGLLFQC